MKIVKKIIKWIKESEVLTKEEKRKLIKRGKIEYLLNSYKIILKFPFLILGILFATLECLFNYLAEIFDLIEQVFSSICIKIDNLKEINLTKGKAREKLIKEIKDKKIYNIY